MAYTLDDLTKGTPYNDMASTGAPDIFSGNQTRNTGVSTLDTSPQPLNPQPTIPNIGAPQPNGVYKLPEGGYASTVGTPNAQGQLPTTGPNTPAMEGTMLIPPSGKGQVFIPSDASNQTLTPQQLQNRVEIGGTPELQRMQREGFMREKNAEMGLRNKINELNKSDLPQTEKDRIQAALSTVKSSEAKNVILGREMKKIADGKPSNGIDDKARQRAVDKSRYKEDEQGNRIPTNIEGRANDAYTWADGMGPDPGSTQSNYDYMSDSERREFNRHTRSMSNGIRNPNGEKRLKDIMSRVERRRQQKYTQAQEAERKEKHDATIAAAKDRMTKSEFQQMKDRADVLYGKYYTAQKKYGEDSPEAAAALKEYEAELNKALGGAAPQNQGAQGKGQPIGVKRDASGKPIQYFYADGTIEDA